MRDTRAYQLHMTHQQSRLAIRKMLGLSSKIPVSRIASRRAGVCTSGVRQALETALPCEPLVAFRFTGCLVLKSLGLVSLNRYVLLLIPWQRPQKLSQSKRETYLFGVLKVTQPHTNPRTFARVLSVYRTRSGKLFFT